MPLNWVFLPSVMSIEYTIDIQLTELAFSEILDSEEAALSTTVKGAGHCASSKPTAESPAPTEQKLKEEEDYKEEEELKDELSQTEDYRCRVCELQLSSIFKLKEHMNQHTGVRPYHCAECRKRFFKVSSFCAHLRKHHTGARLYRCVECRNHFCKVFSYRAHLRKHVQAKELFRCRICLIGFQSFKDLNTHLAMNHLKKEFYECDLCKCLFASLKTYQSHKQLHKTKVGFTCTTCGRYYSTSQSFAYHQKKVCYRVLRYTDCTKTFTQNIALLKHRFSHLGLLPYTCVQCGRHFRFAKLSYQHKCQPQRINCVA